MEIFNQIRKAVASFTLGALLFGFVTPMANAQFGFTDDAEIPSWSYEAIDELMAQGVISGNDDGSFAPNRQLNRAEVSKIIVLASGVDLDVTGGPHFPDVQPGAWYYDYIETMYNNGWINGYPDGMFRPEVGINRAEISKMVVNAFEIDPDTAGAPHFDDVSDSDWFYSYVETAYNYGLMRGYGDGTFGPADAVTRAQTIKIVYDAQLVVTGHMGPAEGTLEVVLSSDTPRGTNIPYNATSVPFTTVEMTASDDADVEISSVTFTRLGLGDNDDFDNVWMEIDGFKVGNDKSVNNDDIVELRFNPPVVIPAGQTVVADVVASLKFKLNSDGTCFGSGTEGCNIGHHNRFALVSADDIVSTAANVVGDFPVEGEEMEVADYQVTQVEFQVLGSDTNIDVGDNFIEIGKFRMLNESTTNKDVELRAITFKNDGIAELEDVLENVALYVSGEQISAETIIDGDYVTFRLDNGVTGGYILEDGDSRIFSIRADVVSAEKGDTINFKVDNFEDVVGVEIGTSFGVKAVSRTKTSLSSGTSAGTTDTSLSADADAEDDNARLRLYTIDTGDLNVSRDPSSLSNQEYAPGSNDVVFLTARLVVDQPLIVDGVDIKVGDSVGIADLSELNTNFDNFRLFLNDKLIDSENEFNDGDGVTTSLVGDFLDFNTTFEIAGTSVLKVVGNIQDEADTGDQLRLELFATDFDAPEYISTGDQVEDSQLLGSAEGSFVEVEQSTLTVTRSDGLSDNDDIVAGVDDVTFLEFVLNNNDSGDVNVTSVSIKALGTGPAATTFSNFTTAIFVDGVQQGSSKNLSSTGVATFNDLSVIVPSSEQKEFTVVVDTIEESADSNPASTTLVAGGSGNTTATGASLCAVGTVSATNSIGTVNCPGGILADVAVGDTLVIDAAGAADNVIVTVAASTGATQVSVQASTVDADHAAVNLNNVDVQYPTTTTQVSVASANNLAVGDIISIAGATGGDGVNTTLDNEGLANDYCVKALSGTTVTLGVIPDPAAGNTCNSGVATITTFGAAALTVGAAVTEISASATIRYAVTAIDADNVENGQSVQVLEESIALGTGNADTTGDGNCDGGTADNFLCGVVFDLIQSGTLTISQETIVPGHVIVANASDVEVLRIRFNAADDDVEIKDLYLENDVVNDNVPDNTDIGQRVDFKLYDASGNFLSERQMQNGVVHFELSSGNRIRVPKDDSTFVSVKVDARNINEANQTAKRLDVHLDTDNTGAGVTNGVEAITAATGTDLAATAVSGDVEGEGFVVYRSAVTVQHAATQPTVSDPSLAEQEFYRFTVTADAARQIELGKVTLNVTLQGMNFDTSTAPAAAPTYRVLRVNSNGSLDNTVIATATGTGVADNATLDTVSINFTGQNLTAGESRTYALLFDRLENDASAQSDDDAVTATIVYDTTYAAPANKATAQGASNFVWSDEASSSHSNTSADWLNGFLIDQSSDTTSHTNADPS